MIVKREKTEANNEMLLQIEMDSIKVHEKVISFAVLGVTITKDDTGNYVYGLNMTTPDLDKENMTPEEINTARGAEMFIQRALQLVMNELDEVGNEEQKAEEKPN